MNLVGQLGHGGGTAFIASAQNLQSRHTGFKDELEEPSALLSPPKGVADPTSLYSFLVQQRHPMHRHEGRRVFIAVSGSQGAELRFCGAADADLKDPPRFAQQIERIIVPPDSLFAVRFGSRLWHQFVGMIPAHPAFFALSVHPDETSGNLSPALRKQVEEERKPSIAALTEVLPFEVPEDVVKRSPVVSMSLEAGTSKVREAVCLGVRGSLGSMRSAMRRKRGSWLMQRTVFETPPELLGLELLDAQLAERPVDHEDGFLAVFDVDDNRASPQEILANILRGFLENRPATVGLLMRVRNLLVMPLRLRRSPLACPVSSLLGSKSERLFAGEFPVWDYKSSHDQAEVVLGANDRHVQFRTVVGIRKLGDGRRVQLSMSTKLRTLNLFGRFYMRVIDVPHRKFISPLIMQYAIDYVQQKQ